MAWSCNVARRLELINQLSLFIHHWNQAVVNVPMGSVEILNKDARHIECLNFSLVLYKTVTIIMHLLP